MDMQTNNPSQEDGRAIFTMRPGNIASVVNLDTPDWGQQTWIYTEHGKAPEPDPAGALKGLRFDDLPGEVKKAIQDQFDDVFSRPLPYRSDFMRACTPRRIEVDWDAYSPGTATVKAEQASRPRMG